MDQSKKVIKIGTRGSKLALRQTEMVIDAIQTRYHNLECETVVIHTTGDKILDKPLLEFGGKGVFVSEFEEALLRGEIDLAVHSAKDMPLALSDGLEIAGVLKREDPRDVLITKKELSIEEKKILKIGTSSLRRQMQIESIYDNVKCSSLRGNITTRLQKLEEGLYDGIILAAAGIKRLSLEKEAQFDYKYFDMDEMIPAGGQGIIAIEGRKGSKVCELISQISDKITMQELETERKVLELLEAGCHEAVGAISNIENERIFLQVIKEENGEIIKKQGTDELENRMKLAECLVKSL